MSTSIVANNIATAGRSVFIRSNPVVGLLALTGFTDDANNPGGGASFVKTFRYAVNGVQWTNWQPLTIASIMAITVDPLEPFLIEVNYEKDEPVGNSALTVSEFTIPANNQATPLTPFFNNSLFARYFGAYDQGVLNWYVNVLQKLWDKGLIPNYMTRDQDDPEDFLAMWSAVCQFFAYYVTFARMFATFYNNTDLLTDFLNNRGLNVSTQDTLGQMQAMLQTFYYQMSRRGTNAIWQDSDGSSDPTTGVTGEFKRLVNYETIDEFLFLLFRPQNFGWNLGNSSPLYKGLRVNDGLNKAPWSVGYNSMTLAAPYLSSGGTVTTDGSLTVAQLNDSSIGTQVSMKVDSNLDYEFSFQVKMAAGKKLSFDIIGSDSEGNSQQLLSYKDGTAKTSFFDNAVLYRSDKYLMVRCYLYNSQRGTFSGDTTNIRQGQNLVMTANVQAVSFSVSCTGQANIYDFKILPVQTDWSRGFIQVNNFIATWLKNRNQTYTTAELTEYVSRYLIPYNSHLVIKNSGDVVYNEVETEPDTTFWIGAGQYCQTVVWVGIDPSCETVNLIWVPEESTSFCEQTS